MIRKILKIVFIILTVVIFLVGLQCLLNGGIAMYREAIADEGFFGFIKWFFVSIWDGFKTTFGIK